MLIHYLKIDHLWRETSFFVIFSSVPGFPKRSSSSTDSRPFYPKKKPLYQTQNYLRNKTEDCINLLYKSVTISWSRIESNHAFYFHKTHNKKQFHYPRWLQPGQQGLHDADCISCWGGKTHAKSGVLDITIKCIWLLGFNCGDLGNIKYPFIANIPKSSMTGAPVPVRFASIGQIDIFESYSIEIFDTV